MEKTEKKKKEPNDSSSSPSSPSPLTPPSSSTPSVENLQEQSIPERRNLMSVVIPHRRNSNPFRPAHNVIIYPLPAQLPPHPHYHNSAYTSTSPSLPSSSTSTTFTSQQYQQQLRYLPTNPNLLLSDPSSINKRFKPSEESSYLVEDPFNSSTSFTSSTQPNQSGFSEYNSEFSEWPQWIGGGGNPSSQFNNPSNPVPNPQLNPQGNYFYDVNSLPAALVQTQQVFSTTSRSSRSASFSSNSPQLRKNSNSSTSSMLNPMSNAEESDEDSLMDFKDHIAQDGGVFELREQPKPKQRKSYKKENRYLLPNPTQINLTDAYKKKNGLPLDSLQISNANCSVKLVDGNGNQLPHSPSHYLEDTDGSLVKDYDPEQGGFEFTLKVRQNSGPEKFRLAFQVKYNTSDGTLHKEKIVSNPFLVQSNKSFFSKDPKLKGMHPVVGTNKKQNEIWIKGRDFNEKGVVVLVDKIQAEILEIQSNLIIALTPIREDLKEKKMVKVTVSNLFKQKMVPSEQFFHFTYLIPSKEGHVFSDLAFKRSASPSVASKENSS